MQPMPAAVTAWRNTLSFTSPAANTPATGMRAIGRSLDIALASISTWPWNSWVAGEWPMAMNRPCTSWSCSDPVTVFRSLTPVTPLVPGPSTSVGVRGRVLPMCTDPLDIEADVTGLDDDIKATRRIRGQVAIATTPGQVQRIRLHPTGKPGELPTACPQAVEAVLGADLSCSGPGSWFTSVLPHLLVPELHEALVSFSARKVVILNLVPQPGETAGFSPEQHLDVLCEHAPRLRVDAVIADVDSVATPDRLVRAAGVVGARTHLLRVAAPGAPDRHDPQALAESLRAAIGLARGGRGRNTQQGRYRLVPVVPGERDGEADGEEYTGGDDR